MMYGSCPCLYGSFIVVLVCCDRTVFTVIEKWTFFNLVFLISCDWDSLNVTIREIAITWELRFWSPVVRFKGKWKDYVILKKTIRLNLHFCIIDCIQATIVQAILIYPHGTQVRFIVPCELPAKWIHRSAEHPENNPPLFDGFEPLILCFGSDLCHWNMLIN